MDIESYKKHAVKMCSEGDADKLADYYNRPLNSHSYLYMYYIPDLDIVVSPLQLEMYYPDYYELTSTLLIEKLKL